MFDTRLHAAQQAVGAALTQAMTRFPEGPLRDAMGYGAQCG